MVAGLTARLKVLSNPFDVGSIDCAESKHLQQLSSNQFVNPGSLAFALIWFKFSYDSNPQEEEEHRGDGVTHWFWTPFTEINVGNGSIQRKNNPMST